MTVKIINKLFVDFNIYDLHKLIQDFNEVYIEKTSRCFEIRYNQHVSEKNFKIFF